MERGNGELLKGKPGMRDWCWAGKSSSCLLSTPCPARPILCLCPSPVYCLDAWPVPICLFLHLPYRSNSDSSLDGLVLALLHSAVHCLHLAQPWCLCRSVLLRFYFSFYICGYWPLPFLFCNRKCLNGIFTYVISFNFLKVLMKLAEQMLFPPSCRCANWGLDRLA